MSFSCLPCSALLTRRVNFEARLQSPKPDNYFPMMFFKNFLSFVGRWGGEGGGGASFSSTYCGMKEGEGRGGGGGGGGGGVGASGLPTDPTFYRMENCCAQQFPTMNHTRAPAVMSPFVAGRGRAGRGSVVMRVSGVYMYV